MADYNLGHTGAEVNTAVSNAKDIYTGGTESIRLGSGAGELGQGGVAVAIGPGAGRNNQGAYSVAVGYNAGAESQPNYTIAMNATENAASPSATKQIVIGSADFTVKIGDGNVQSVSDARDKFDVTDSPVGLDFIKALTPKFYKYDIRELYEETTESGGTIKHSPDGTKAGKRFHAGLIAQEVKVVMDAQGVDFGLFRDESIGATDAHKERAKDKLALCYQELIPVLIKAVQELSTKIETLEGK